MKEPIRCARNTVVITSFLLIIPSVAAYAAETACQASCAADLTECRKQVDKTTMTESHPILVDSSSTRTRYATGQASALVDPKELANPQNEEVQRRRMERNQVCATDNSKCLNSCLPARDPSKNSVIFK
jgi:hypothetical protein